MTQVIRSLPESEWYKCRACGGAGSYFMERDLHRSAGELPCQHCHNGVVKTHTVECDYDPKTGKFTPVQ